MAILEQALPEGRSPALELDLTTAPRPFSPRSWSTSIVPHVLVVDDDEETAKRVREALGDMAAVSVARDAYQALDHLGVSDVDLMLVEVFLPGASGLELLRRLGARHPHRVVAVTHSARVVRIAPEFRIDDVLPKPPAPERLRAELVAAIEQASPAWVGPSLSA